jgi:hypothetical protein
VVECLPLEKSQLNFARRGCEVIETRRGALVSCAGTHATRRESVPGDWQSATGRESLAGRAAVLAPRISSSVESRSNLGLPEEPERSEPERCWRRIVVGTKLTTFRAHSPPLCIESSLLCSIFLHALSLSPAAPIRSNLTPHHSIFSGAPVEFLNSPVPHTLRRRPPHSSSFLMQWVAGKLTKPAFKEGFKYLQHSRPNSILTQHVAELATADNPMAPSGEDAPFDAVQGSQGGENQTGSRSLRDRAVGSIGKRAKSYALTKGLNMVWSQIMLPLTIVLWVIKLLTSFVESRQVAAALRFKSESTHASDVQRVVAQVKAMPEGRLIASKKPAAQGHMQRSNEAKKILGPASSLSSNGGVGTLHLVDLSRLNSVISLDTRAKTCRVQASCTFRNLLRVTTDSHLMPAVVPPYLDMTVGGACVGSAIGSASWKSGAFIDGVREIEVVLGSGEVLRITREGEHAALFAGLHSSYHSLGTIVAVTIDLVKAPRYLWMRYELYTSLDKATERLQSLLQVRQSEANSTLEGLVFDQKNIVLAMSQGIDVIDTQQHKVVGFGHWW